MNGDWMCNDWECVLLIHKMNADCVRCRRTRVRNSVNKWHWYKRGVVHIMCWIIIVHPHRRRCCAATTWYCTPFTHCCVSACVCPFCFLFYIIVSFMCHWFYTLCETVSVCFFFKWFNDYEVEFCAASFAQVEHIPCTFNLTYPFAI